MDEKPALSDVNISYSQQELPPSVETVLKKIESAQLTRAKQEIAEQLQVIQNRVNQALSLQEEILKDENESLFDKEETKKRSQMLYAFFRSSLEKENELDGVLQWLKDIAEELQGIEDDEDFKCSDNITEEWVEEMEVKIQTFMSDIMSCFERAQKLCALLFDTDIRKTKEKNVFGKDGVWRWWREPEVDPRTILKIWKLQPPSADRIVSEISFGTKTATELSFMLVDMAKSLSCGKAMGIAFKFVQIGLCNLNDAFQAQSRRVEQLHTLQEQNAEKWQAALKYTKTELEVRQRMVARLEKENCMLREENAACLLQLRQQQEASQQQTALTAPSGEEYIQDIQSHYLLSRTPQVTKCTSLSQKLHNIIETPQITEKEASPQLQLEPLEFEVDYFQGERCDQVSSATEESSSENRASLTPAPEHADVFEVMEKKCSTLLKDFQSIVVNIIDTSLRKRSHKWDMKRQLEDVGLNSNTNDTVNLYTILLNIIHESFKKLDIRLPCQVPETILQKLDQGRSSDDTSKTSKVSKMFSKRMRDHEAPTHIGDKQARKKDESGQDPFSTVTDQFSNAKNKRKEQTSKLHLDLKSFPEMPGQMKTERIGQTADKTYHSFQEDLKDTSTLSSDSSLDEKVEVNEVPQLHQKSTEGPKFKRRVTRSHIMKLESAPQDPDKPLPSETLLLSESEGHFNEDMEPEEEKIARTLLKGVRYQMNKETQRTNLLLLQNALRKGQISLQLYKQARALLENIPSAKQKCLSFLLRKYVAFKALQRVRYQLNIKIRFAREHKDGQALKEYYIILTKLDKYEKEVLGRWRRRQEAQEQKYRVNLTRIIHMFNQLREAYSLNLQNPNSCQSYSLGKHFLAFKPQGTQRSMISRQQCPPFPSVKTPTYLLRPRNITTFNPGSREPVRSEAPTVWKCSQTLNDVQLTSTTVPIIPRLLEMNIKHSNISALRTVQGRTGG